jgi:hypothetical protein
MSATARRATRALAVGTPAGAAWLLLGAEPAAAHDVAGGELPAPPWLLAYLGAALVAAAAVALRATWPAHRLRRTDPVTATPATQEGEAAETVAVTPGRMVGTVLLALVLAAAVIGPDSGAANIAPVAVLVVWWVGLPILCLVAGDVMRAINPFVPLTAVLDRGRAAPGGRAAPAWTAAAFLASFTWFFTAYHRPGSPRALAVYLAVYVLAALAGALWWGRSWLVTGEGFGGLSAAVAALSPWGGRAPRPPGLAPLCLVWLGGSAFDAFASTPFWVDVLGTSRGWSRTLLNTVGLVWLTAIAAGVYLVAVRLADARQGDEASAPARPVPLVAALGTALVPLATAWFVAHDLTLLLFEGQNFIALLSDPLGEGWDLFGTIGRTIDFGIVQSAWVRWTQVAVLAAGHVAGVVLAHDAALANRRRRDAIRVTWAMAGASAASLVAAVLLVLE